MTPAQRDRKLDALHKRLQRIKGELAVAKTSRQLRQIERDLRAWDKALRGIPPLPADHLERHIRQTICQAWQHTVPAARANAATVNTTGTK